MAHPLLRAAWRPLLLPMLAAALVAGCSKPEPVAPGPEPRVEAGVVAFPGQKDPTSLRTAEVAAAGDAEVILPGRLAWDEDRTARVWAPYAGRVERLLVGVGERVRRGQALALVSSADVGQAQADLHKAEADLRRAEADGALATSSLARARELAEAGVIARKDLEQAQADAARAAADAARGQAEAARARARLAQYGVAGSAVTQAITLVAPIDGVVVERNANPGAEVRPDVSTPALFTLSDPGSLWASIDLGETQLALLKPGQAMALSAAAWPGERFEATVLSVGESVDAASRTVKVRARVPNAARKLKAEMFVSAAVRQAGALPQVPADAVFLRGEQQSVFVQRGAGRYERRDVQVRPAGPQAWNVVAGLKPGERVVVGGALYLNQLVDAAR